MLEVPPLGNSALIQSVPKWRDQELYFLAGLAGRMSPRDLLQHREQRGSLQRVVRRGQLPPPVPGALPLKWELAVLYCLYLDQLGRWRLLVSVGGQSATKFNDEARKSPTDSGTTSRGELIASRMPFFPGLSRATPASSSLFARVEGSKCRSPCKISTTSK